MNSMKDSGVEWIGKIPENWNIMPIKYVLKSKKGLNITKADLVDNGIAVISYGQIHSKVNNGVHISSNLIRYISKENSNISYSSLMNLGDIVFADTSEDYEGIGNAVLNDYNGEIFAGYHTIIMSPKIEVNSKYLSYQFLTDAWRWQLRSLSFGVKVYSVTQKIINQSFVLLPSLQEQQAIADFLDIETKKLDDAKDLLQQQIEKLKEYRKSLIWESVTKGLDKSVPMKDSGVDWIGMIPKDWITEKIKYLTKYETSQYTTNEVVNTNEVGFPLYDAQRIIGYIEKYDRKEEYISIIKDGAGTGRVRINKSKSSVLATMGYIIPQNINLGFLFYVFVEIDFNFYIQGSTIPHIYFKDYGNLRIPNPPLEEQQAIADFLDEKTSIIEKIILNTQSQIEVIEKQKKTLIYDYVTGKRRVI